MPHYLDSPRLNYDTLASWGNAPAAFKPLECEGVVCSVTATHLKLGRGCGSAANPLARSLAARIREDIIGHVKLYNDWGCVILTTPEGDFDFALPESAIRFGNRFARGEAIEPFEFLVHLPPRYTVPLDYVPRVPMACYPGSKNWSWFARDTVAGRKTKRLKLDTKPTTWGETSSLKKEKIH